VKTRLIGLLAAFALAVGGSLTGTGPAQAAGPAIQITKLYYDSPGSDTGSTTSLNAEWVRLTNKRTYSINLKYWTLRDRAGHVYRFGGDFWLRPGSNVYVHTGKGTNNSSNRYWGRSWYVWNNTGDTAYLRNAAGTLIDTCAWSTRGSGYTYC